MLKFTERQTYAIKEVVVQMIGLNKNLVTNQQWYTFKNNADQEKLWLTDDSFVLLGQATGPQLVKWLFQHGFGRLDEIFWFYKENVQERENARIERAKRMERAYA